MKIESSRQTFTERTKISIFWAPDGAKKENRMQFDNAKEEYMLYAYIYLMLEAQTQDDRWSSTI